MYENGFWDYESRSICNGIQRAIVRNNRCYNVNDTFSIGLVKFKVVGLFRRTMEYAVTKLHYQCGFPNEETMIDWWNSHNATTPYHPNRMVYIHFIEEIGRK